MEIMSFIRLFGGLAIFIYGMTIMGDGLERLAGSKLEKTLEKVAGNLIKAIFMGMMVTVVIQSSSATTVMVIGFVNAGIMTLRQSVGIILGANIGTTITAQIIRLDSGGDITGNFFMQIIKPSNFAYVAVLIGVILLVMSASQKRKDIGIIFVGFGVLFIGMSTMEAAVSPLKDIPEFQNLFLSFSNPILGVLIGALVTAVIQSSSASVGILQALSTTGMITYASAIPIILGQNIGTCITAILSSINANKNAKRAACIHFYFNFIGSVLFLIVVYAIQYTIGFSFWDDVIDKAGIANFHTVFNILTVVAFVPFSNVLVSLAEKTFPIEKTAKNPLARLDPRFLNTPDVALDQCLQSISEMAETAFENYNIATSLLDPKGTVDRSLFNENEKFLDTAEVEIAKYLLSIRGLSDSGKLLQLEMQRSLMDFEKVGDYSKNIEKSLTRIREDKADISELAMSELKVMSNAVAEVISLTKDAYLSRDERTARNVEPLEDVVDTLKETLRTKHLERLNKNECSMQSGHYYIEIVNYLEKISDHCANIAIYIIQQQKGYTSYNTHSYAMESDKKEVAYRETFNQFSLKYLSQL